MRTTIYPISNLLLFVALMVGLWSCREKETAPSPEKVNLTFNCTPSSVKTLSADNYLLTVAKGELDNAGKLVYAYYYNITSYVNNSTILRKYINTYNPDGTLLSTEYQRDSVSGTDGGHFLFPTFKTTFSQLSASELSANYYNYINLQYQDTNVSYSSIIYANGNPASLQINTPGLRDNSLQQKTISTFETDANGNITKVLTDTAFKFKYSPSSYYTQAEATYSSKWTLPLNQVIKVITPDALDSLPFKNLPETFNNYSKLPGQNPVLNTNTSFSVVADSVSAGQPVILKLLYRNGKSTAYTVGYDFCR